MKQFLNDNKHFYFALFWPVYLLAFFVLERLSSFRGYHEVSCAWDRLIPFCEVFVPAYCFWFVWLIFFQLYAAFREKEAFIRFIRFLLVTNAITAVIYLVWPSGQSLRPETFARENVFTAIMGLLYQLDTNTNVCPSLHVIDSIGLLLGSWNLKLNGEGARKKGFRTAWILCCVLISISTVFLKQHAILDVAAAIPVCLVGWYAAFRK